MKNTTLHDDKDINESFLIYKLEEAIVELKAGKIEALFFATINKTAPDDSTYYAIKSKSYELIGLVEKGKHEMLKSIIQ